MLQRNYVTPRNFHSSSSNYLFPIFNNFVQIILSVTCMLSKVQVRLSTVRAGCQLALSIISNWDAGPYHVVQLSLALLQSVQSKNTRTMMYFEKN